MAHVFLASSICLCSASTAGSRFFRRAVSSFLGEYALVFHLYCWKQVFRRAGSSILGEYAPVFNLYCWKQVFQEGSANRACWEAEGAVWELRACCYL